MTNPALQEAKRNLMLSMSDFLEATAQDTREISRQIKAAKIEIDPRKWMTPNEIRAAIGRRRDEFMRWWKEAEEIGGPNFEENYRRIGKNTKNATYLIRWGEVQRLDSQKNSAEAAHKKIPLAMGGARRVLTLSKRKGGERVVAKNGVKNLEKARG